MYPGTVPIYDELRAAGDSEIFPGPYRHFLKNNPVWERAPRVFARDDRHG